MQYADIVILTQGSISHRYIPKTLRTDIVESYNSKALENVAKLRYLATIFNSLYIDASYLNDNINYIVGKLSISNVLVGYNFSLPKYYYRIHYGVISRINNIPTHCTSGIIDAIIINKYYKYITIELGIPLNIKMTEIFNMFPLIAVNGDDKSITYKFDSEKSSQFTIDRFLPYLREKYRIYACGSTSKTLSHDSLYIKYCCIVM